LIKFELHLANRREREKRLWVDLAFVKYAFHYFVDVLILFCMTNSSFLKLRALAGENDEATGSLKDLHQDYHFFVLHEVEGAGFEIDWIL
jgi:hypothetical protein